MLDQGLSDTWLKLKEMISDVVSWPNCNFIPQDPLEIVLWDEHGDSDLRIASALGAIESTFLVPIDWDVFFEGTLGELVGFLSDME